ncbi:unnamed protein product [Haemonchus placei]|uniref:HTH OST-type domain-containing protein n=1 Tax=Haemonchus placei TaxID=6290 RepID=A0A158QK79_HAEPC|nr:unnamed protein product [Haemonchus placei]
MLPSTSTAANVPDEVIVRDAALCLRSFCGERQSIPYSKFCERFKKVIGYSLKEHLLKCKFTFADLIEHIAATTRTKCHYDAEHKMIQLLSGQPPNESRSFSIFNPLGAYQSSQIVGPLIPRYPFPLHLDPRLPDFDSDVVAASSSRAVNEDIVPMNSMEHIRLENRGLVNIKNTGLYRSDGDVVNGGQPTEEGVDIVAHSKNPPPSTTPEPPPATTPVPPTLSSEQQPQFAQPPPTIQHIAGI